MDLSNHIQYGQGNLGGAMSIKQYINKKVSDIYFVGALVSAVSGLLVLTIVLAVVTISTPNDKQIDTSASYIAADTPGAAAMDIQANLVIMQDESEERQYESIKTQMFTIVDRETKAEKSVMDGTLSIEDVKATLDNYLEQNKYKIMSIGLVNNKFYIQQDITQPVDKAAKVGIIGLADGFSADDWIKLTEAVYNKVTVEADSLFAASSNIGNKHFIYAYNDKEQTVVENTTEQ